MFILPHFAKKHDELNEKIDNKAAQASELDALKKEKLKLKDEIYAQVLKYKEQK